MFNLRLAAVFSVIVISAIASGCSGTAKHLEYIEYTSFEKLDKLTSDKIEFTGTRVLIDSITTQAISDTPSESSDYVWVINYGHNFDSKDLYGSFRKPRRYQFAFRNIPIQNYQKFFRDTASKRLKAAGGSDLHIGIDVKKITLITWDLGLQKYRACNMVIGVKSQVNEVVASSEIKMQDSFTTFSKASTLQKTLFKFDPKGLDIVELAFVDALQQGLSQLAR